MPGEDKKCLLCGENANIKSIPNRADTYQYICSYCGAYIITGLLKYELVNCALEDKLKIAAYLKERILKDLPVPWLFARQSEIQNMGTNELAIGIDTILNNFPSKISEILDRVLLNLNRCTQYFGQSIPIDPNKHLPLFYATRAHELLFICESLKNKGLIECHFEEKRCDKNEIILAGDSEIHITVDGLSYISDLEQSKEGGLSMQVFVAMAFQSEGHNLINAFEQGIRPAIEDDCQYDKAFRTDYHEHNEVIDDVIISEIRRSKFMVADLTEHRNGVYFEAGVMHGLGREVIYTVHQDHADRTHFDLAHRNQIRWSTSDDLRAKLANRIKATII